MLDDLSDWTLPPPAARAGGENEPVRVFSSAEAALAFLARLDDDERNTRLALTSFDKRKILRHTRNGSQ